jgi:Domain of unknown function (DUF4394)
MPQESEAQRRGVLRRLSGGQSVVLLAQRCSLSVVAAQESRVRVRCAGQASTSPRGPGQRVSRGQTATVTARGCFLRVASRSPRRVVVRCARSQPTPVPTLVPPSPTTAPTVAPTTSPSPTPLPSPSASPNAVALAANNTVISFNTSSPSTTSSVLPLSGVATGTELVSIDRRPQNGHIYALGYNPSTNTPRLYHITLISGRATSLDGMGALVDSGGTTPVTLGLANGLTKFGIDFNPTVDRLRVVNSLGFNFRVNPNTGSAVDGSSMDSGVQPDGNINGTTSAIGETAYTNNAPNQSVTTQFTIGVGSIDALFIQNPPNSGTQTAPLTLSSGGSPLDVIEVRGFDIGENVNTLASNTPPSMGSGLALLELASNSQQVVATVDLTTGQVTNTSQIGNGTSELLGLTLAPTSNRSIVALTIDGGLLRFNEATPGTSTRVDHASPTSGEALVGIDYRPSTGQLFAIGINDSANTGTLYLVDPQTGALTVVGNPSSISFVNSAGMPVDLPPVTVGYGLDFNPTNDIIRVVTPTGLNFRVSPATGAGVDGDSTAAGINPDFSLNGATTVLHAASHTSSFGGAPFTTLYGVNATNHKLYVSSAPQSGTQTELASISANFEDLVGFEIPSLVQATMSGTPVSSGLAYSSLTISGNTRLCTINLVTGEARDLGLIGNGTTRLRSIAVGE